MKVGSPFRKGLVLCLFAACAAAQSTPVGTPAKDQRLALISQTRQSLDALSLKVDAARAAASKADAEDGLRLRTRAKQLVDLQTAAEHRLSQLQATPADWTREKTLLESAVKQLEDALHKS